MFPSSLQKNIQELDRQISLLETECENMETGNRSTGSGKQNQKPFAWEKEKKQFVCPGSCPHSPVFVNLPRNNSVIFPQTDTSRSFVDLERSENVCFSKRSLEKENSDESGRTQTDLRQGERKMSCVSFDVKKPRKHAAVECIQEDTEENDDAYPIRIEVKVAKSKNTQSETAKEHWCDVAEDEKWSNRNNCKKNSNGELFQERRLRDSKFSSDEELTQSKRKAETQFIPSENSNKEFSHKKIMTKRRSRSARTRKNSEEVPLDLNIRKINHEEEFSQTEETEKLQFLFNLNKSIKTLQLLINEMKSMSSREKKTDLLNDVHNTLMKLIGIKTLNDSNVSIKLKRNNANLSEGEENVLEMRQALFAVKKFCRELSEEKSALSEELNSKSNTIINLKKKEKEYISVISSLKYNLEKMREECEEGKLAKKDLSAAKTKLWEEAKVIETLKKKHEKMQSLIEHYVLVNDKLRAEMKITKLESQKFHVLLSAKEMEITKYKQEIELFQKQITQQLNLLRSKATENDIEKAIEAISNQTNILETDEDSTPSESTLVKGGVNVLYHQSGSGSSNRTVREKTNKKESLFRDKISTEKREESTRLSNSSQDLKEEVEGNIKESGFTSCKSEDSTTDTRPEVKFYNSKLNGVYSGSQNLRESINEMLQEIEKESSEKLWPSNPISNNTSQCSLLSSCSENVKK